MSKERKQPELIVWGPRSREGASQVRVGWELSRLRGIITSDEYPVDRQAYLLMLSNVIEEAHQDPNLKQDKVKGKAVKELGIILLEEAGLIPVRPVRGIDLKPAA